MASDPNSCELANRFESWTVPRSPLVVAEKPVHGGDVHPCAISNFLMRKARRLLPCSQLGDDFQDGPAALHYCDINLQ